ncbi:unnamed protein product [Symbiodinium sp. KB8]|nr:unnamed protein product [Symbiodinium sp. KB8]
MDVWDKRLAVVTVILAALVLSLHQRAGLDAHTHSPARCALVEDVTQYEMAVNTAPPVTHAVWPTDPPPSASPRVTQDTADSQAGMDVGQDYYSVSSIHSQKPHSGEKRQRHVERHGKRQRASLAYPHDDEHHGADGDESMDLDLEEHGLSGSMASSTTSTDKTPATAYSCSSDTILDMWEDLGLALPDGIRACVEDLEILGMTMPCPPAATSPSFLPPEAWPVLETKLIDVRHSTKIGKGASAIVMSVPPGCDALRHMLTIRPNLMADCHGAFVWKMFRWEDLVQPRWRRLDYSWCKLFRPPQLERLWSHHKRHMQDLAAFLDVQTRQEQRLLKQQFQRQEAQFRRDHQHLTSSERRARSQKIRAGRHHQHRHMMAKHHQWRELQQQLQRLADFQDLTRERQIQEVKRFQAKLERVGIGRGILECSPFLSETLVHLIMCQQVMPLCPHVLPLRMAVVQAKYGSAGLLLDRVSGALKDRGAKLTAGAWDRVLLQTFAVLLVAQSMVQFKHHDLHLDNIFLGAPPKRIPRGTRYLWYRFNSPRDERRGGASQPTWFRIPFADRRLEQWVYLADFGYSSVTDPATNMRIGRADLSPRPPPLFAYDRAGPQLAGAGPDPYEPVFTQDSRTAEWHTQAEWGPFDYHFHPGYDVHYLTACLHEVWSLNHRDGPARDREVNPGALKLKTSRVAALRSLVMGCPATRTSKQKLRPFYRGVSRITPRDVLFRVFRDYIVASEPRLERGDYVVTSEPPV